MGSAGHAADGLRGDELFFVGFGESGARGKHDELPARQPACVRVGHLERSDGADARVDVDDARGLFRAAAISWIWEGRLQS